MRIIVNRFKTSIFFKFSFQRWVLNFKKYKILSFKNNQYSLFLCSTFISPKKSWDQKHGPLSNHF